MGRLIDADALSAKLEAECRNWEGESAYQAGLCAAAAMAGEMIFPAVFFLRLFEIDVLRRFER